MKALVTAFNQEKTLVGAFCYSSSAVKIYFTFPTAVLQLGAGWRGELGPGLRRAGRARGLRGGGAVPLLDTETCTLRGPLH